MARYRDVQSFDERAHTYETGWRGEIHHRIGERATSIALACVPTPQRILDIGCGTGFVLRKLAACLPHTVQFAGIDPAPTMIEVARTLSPSDERLIFESGTAEHLPFPDDTFDLVLSTTSFDHWEDQQAGLRECNRVLKEDGYLVLTDLFSVLLLPTIFTTRRGRARTRGRVDALLNATGFRSLTWHSNTFHVIQTVAAAKATQSVSGVE